MPLYHGTSAASALKIIQSQTILPSKDGFFYCFDSNRPESLAGAFCFATGDGPRNGSLSEKNFFSKYARLNPDFPTGLSGIFYKVALKRIASAWANAQMSSATSLLDKQSAILVFHDHQEAVNRTRKGFVHEMKIAGAHTVSLKLECAYFDDSLMDKQEITSIADTGICVKPLSHAIEFLKQQLSDKPSFR